MKNLSIYFFMLFFGLVTMNAQQKNINGLVLDETNQPLPGVKITLKNNNLQNTITDFIRFTKISKIQKTTFASFEL